MKLPNFAKYSFSIALIGAILALAAFAYIFFFNRTTLTITAEAPFVVDVPNFKLLECPTSPCQISVPSGLKTLTFSKSGYQNHLQTLDLPLFGNQQVAVSWMPLPSIALLSEWQPQKYLPADFLQLFENQLPLFSKSADWARLNQELSKVEGGQILAFNIWNQQLLIWQNAALQLQQNQQLTPLPEFTQPFVIGSVTPLFMLAKADSGASQALFLATNMSNISQLKPQIYLGRSITAGQLVINSEQSSAALIDQSPGQPPTLYLFDLKNKTRRQVLQERGLVAIQFLPQNPNLLIYQKRNAVTLKSEIWILDTLQQQGIGKILPFNLELPQIAQIKSQQIVFVEPRVNSLGFLLNAYDLQTEQITTLYQNDNLALPGRLELSPDGNLLVKIESQIYQINHLAK